MRSRSLSTTAADNGPGRHRRSERRAVLRAAPHRATGRNIRFVRKSGWPIRRAFSTCSRPMGASGWITRKRGREQQVKAGRNVRARNFSSRDGDITGMARPGISRWPCASNPAGDFGTSLGRPAPFPARHEDLFGDFLERALERGLPAELTKYVEQFIGWITDRPSRSSSVSGSSVRRPRSPLYRHFLLMRTTKSSRRGSGSAAEDR